MCQFMLLATWWPAKAVATVLALVRFHSLMYKFMLLAIWWPIKTFVTIFALMRFHVCVTIYTAQHAIQSAAYFNIVKNKGNIKQRVKKHVTMTPI